MKVSQQPFLFTRTFNVYSSKEYRTRCLYYLFLKIYHTLHNSRWCMQSILRHWILKRFVKRVQLEWLHWTSKQLFFPQSIWNNNKHMHVRQKEMSTYTLSISKLICNSVGGIYNATWGPPSHLRCERSDGSLYFYCMLSLAICRHKRSSFTIYTEVPCYKSKYKDIRDLINQTEMFSVAMIAKCIHVTFCAF